MSYKLVRLGDIATFKYGKTIRKKEIQEIGKYPVFSGYQTVGFLDNYMFDKEQLIIVCRGVGGTGDIKISPEKCSITNLSIVISVDEELVSKEYLFWVLKMSNTYSLRTGSAQPQITINTLESFDIKITDDKSEQQKIVEILGNLNQKIQLNNETNQTLEQIAQAIFKSWFVDFDPVHAKAGALAEGKSEAEATLHAMQSIAGKTAEQLAQFANTHPKDYAQLKTTAEAFPSGFDEAGIPEGWEYSDINSLAYLNDKSWTKKTAPAEVDYVDLSNTKWGVILSSERYDFKSAPSRARRILRINDTIVGTVRPANGAYAFIKSDGLTGSTGFAVLSPKNEIFSEFIYLCLTRKENIEELARIADGGAYPAVKSDVVAQTPCILPCDEHLKSDILKNFHLLTRDLFIQKDVKLVENETLANTRDILLPKLLSGEIKL